jgi:hypothetical protein
MSGPIRKPVVPPEATQELQAFQVLDVIGADDSPGAKGKRSLDSQSSISPVGLDLAADAGTRDRDEDEEIQVTAGLIIPVRRRRLGKIVVGTLAACGLILVAAGVARVSQASSESSSAAQSTPSTADKGGATPTPTSTTSPGVTPPSAPLTAGARAPDSTSTGTVRIERPAVAGRVWIDGKKVSSSSILVSCGTHQIKVGRGHKHSIDVPCGGDVGVTR